MWVSAFFGGHTPTAVKYTIKYSIYFFVFPALLTMSLQYVRDGTTEVIYKFLLVLTLIFAGFGIYEHFVPDSAFLIWIRQENIFPDRVVSLFNNPNQFGVLMAFGLLNVYVLKKRSSLPHLWWTIPVSVYAIAGTLSESRNMIFTLILSVILAIYPLRIFTKKEVFFTLATSAAVSIIVLATSPRIVAGSFQTVEDIPENITLVQQILSGDQTTIESQDTPHRLRIWYAAATTFREHPLTGTGVRGFTQDIMGGYNAHNMILTVLTELGIPGLILLSAVIASALWNADIYDLRVGLLCSFIFTSQILDFFIHDFSTTNTMIFIFAMAANISIASKSVTDIDSTVQSSTVSVQN
jgi:hypothetical protein